MPQDCHLHRELLRAFSGIHMLQNHDHHTITYGTDSDLDSLDAGKAPPHSPPTPDPQSCGSDVFILSVLGRQPPPHRPPSCLGTRTWDPAVRVPVRNLHFFPQTQPPRMHPPTATLLKQQVVPLTLGKPFLGSILNCSQENMSPEPPTFSVGMGVYRFDFMLS